MIEDIKFAIVYFTFILFTVFCLVFGISKIVAKVEADLFEQKIEILRNHDVELTEDMIYRLIKGE